MLEDIEVVKANLHAYIDNGMFAALFLVGLVFIYLTEKNKAIKNFFVTYSIVCIIIILNPLFYKAVSNVITYDVYWRLFWILPSGVLIAYCSTKIILKQEKKSEKLILFIATIIIIIISGEFIYNKQNFSKVNNLYKIPDEALEVCIAISEDNLENKLVMAPSDLVPYFRQYDANIKLIYGRVPAGYDNDELVVAFDKGDMENVIPHCLKENCNYIVIRNDVFVNPCLEYYGYKLLGQTEHYLVYKLAE